MKTHPLPHTEKVRATGRERLPSGWISAHEASGIHSGVEPGVAMHSAGVLEATPGECSGPFLSCFVLMWVFLLLR